jgi:hypothetical protein
LEFATDRESAEDQRSISGCYRRLKRRITRNGHDEIGEVLDVLQWAVKWGYQIRAELRENFSPDQIDEFGSTVIETAVSGADAEIDDAIRILDQKTALKSLSGPG